MKKILSTLILLSLLFLPMMVAVEVLAHGGGTPKPEDIKAPHIDPIKAFERIINFVFFALLLLAALMIIVAAFIFVTASGDAEKAKTARNFVLYAIIGVVVAFLAKGLVWLAGKIVGGGEGEIKF